MLCFGQRQGNCDNKCTATGKAEEEINFYIWLCLKVNRQFRENTLTL